METQPQTIVVSDITPAIFNQLHLQHAEALSCPCSKINIPYRAFVINKIAFHPVCSSIFVREQWIKAFYLRDASKYGTGDFRTTAYSQVNQCLFRKETLLSIKIPTTKLTQIGFFIENIEFIVRRSFLGDASISASIHV